MMYYYWLMQAVDVFVFKVYFQSLSSILNTSQDIYLIFCLTESVIFFQLLILLTFSVQFTGEPLTAPFYQFFKPQYGYGTY